MVLTFIYFISGIACAPVASMCYTNTILFELNKLIIHFFFSSFVSIIFWIQWNVLIYQLRYLFQNKFQENRIMSVYKFKFCFSLDYNNFWFISSIYRINMLSCKLFVVSFDLLNVSYLMRTIFDGFLLLLLLCYWIIIGFIFLSIHWLMKLMKCE